MLTQRPIASQRRDREEVADHRRANGDRFASLCSLIQLWQEEA
jgi:hypothetical protein